MIMTRHEARELAFVIVFEKSFHDELSIVELIENAVELEILPSNKFAEKLAKKVYDNVEEIDRKIEENLIGWKANRISRASKAIMRIAVCELLFSEDIPVGVVINEAVEIAKKYASPEDASYINGVLGSFVRKLDK